MHLYNRILAQFDQYLKPPVTPVQRLGIEGFRALTHYQSWWARHGSNLGPSAATDQGPRAPKSTWV